MIGQHSLKVVVMKVSDKLILLIGPILVLFPISPWHMPFVGRDSGVFLYIGWRILNGELPYRDVWDHKPPVIFYIDALGLALTKQTRWGVWMIEAVGLLIATFVGYRLLRRVFGKIPALLSSVLWTLTLVFVIEGGNFTTEYTLPLQFLALYLFFTAYNTEKSIWRWFLLGMIGAVAFFTKQTAIGIWLAITIFLIVDRLRSNRVGNLIRELLLLSLGALPVFVFIVLFFVAHDAFWPFWDASFRYNFVYVTVITNISDRLLPLTYGIHPLTNVGLFQFGVAGYFLALIFLFYNRDAVKSWIPLLIVGLIDFPVELVLISSSGWYYGHYYMILLPVLALFSGFLFWVLFHSMSYWQMGKVAQCLMAVSLIIVFVWSALPEYRYVLTVTKYADPLEVVDYIDTHTSSDDYVLLWGAESSINYFSRRRSPTRFVYQYPLYVSTYVTEDMILSFLNDVISHKPCYIIDTKNHKAPMFDFPIQSDVISAKIELLKSQYQYVEDLNGGSIYKRVE